VHLIEDLPRMVRWQVLEKVNRSLFIERLKDVCCVVRIVLRQLFPSVVVRIEILLGFIWSLASEIPER
jgi:hypothetical protein